MEGKKYNLKNDIIFKTFFSRKGNEEYLKDFLNGTDASLTDRYNTFFANNQLSCQANCEFSEFNLSLGKLKIFLISFTSHHSHLLQPQSLHVLQPPSNTSVPPHSGHLVVLRDLETAFL